MQNDNANKVMRVYWQNREKLFIYKSPDLARTNNGFIGVVAPVCKTTLWLSIRKCAKSSPNTQEYYQLIYFVNKQVSILQTKEQTIPLAREDDRENEQPRGLLFHFF